MASDLEIRLAKIQAHADYIVAKLNEPTSEDGYVLGMRNEREQYILKVAYVSGQYQWVIQTAAAWNQPFPAVELARRATLQWHQNVEQLIVRLLDEGDCDVQGEGRRAPNATRWQLWVSDQLTAGQGHCYHWRVLETLKQPSCPLRRELGTEAAIGALDRARDVRNRVKNQGVLDAHPAAVNKARAWFRETQNLPQLLEQVQVLLNAAVNAAGQYRVNHPAYPIT